MNSSTPESEKPSNPNDADDFSRQLLELITDLELHPSAPQVPPYQTGEVWLNSFLNKPEAEKAEEYIYQPDFGIIQFVFKETTSTHLGATYFRILSERDKDKEPAIRNQYRDFDLGNVENFRQSILRGLEVVQEKLLLLKDNPSLKFEIGLVSVSAPTKYDAQQKFDEKISGSNVHWYDTKADDIQVVVKRAAFLRLLNIPVTGQNRISHEQPTFGARIETDGSTERIMRLYWGWGSPHVFYAIDVTESKDVKNPNVTISDKIVIASAYDIAKHFVLFNTSPQDMVYEVPTVA
jgi:hypothetical protein